MKRFLGFVRKEFIHIFRDYRTLVILFGIPATQIIIFGYVVSNDLKSAGIAILDQSRDEITVAVSSAITASGFFHIAAEPRSEAEIDAVFRKGDIKAVIIFGNGFGKRLLTEGVADVAIIADGSEPNVANLVNGYTTAIINGYLTGLMQNGPEVKMPVVPEVKMLYNPELRSHFMFVPGVITLILILVCALMTSVTITREKESGTMEVLLVSPLRPVQIILGKVAPYFILSFVNVIVILLLSYFVFRLPVKGSMVLLLAECMLYILMGLSLGIFISTTVATMQQAIFISFLGLLLPSLLLSGFIFPIEYMPGIYDYISFILPPRWFVVIIKSIMIKGSGLGDIWRETLFILAATILFIGLSIRKFKNRLE
ncbi:MAG: ABC transporter permease [Bacteroidetes bacterium]|nr:ABC transporter permease [Bacteroidota bacterium]